MLSIYCILTLSKFSKIILYILQTLVSLQFLHGVSEQSLCLLLPEHKSWASQVPVSPDSVLKTLLLRTYLVLTSMSS